MRSRHNAQNEQTFALCAQKSAKFSNRSCEFRAKQNKIHEVLWAFSSPLFVCDPDESFETPKISALWYPQKNIRSIKALTSTKSSWKVRFLMCASYIFAERKNSAKSVDFGREKTAQKQRTKIKKCTSLDTIRWNLGQIKVLPPSKDSKTKKKSKIRPIKLMTFSPLNQDPNQNSDYFSFVEIYKKI